MARYGKCPSCGRKAKKGDESTFFDVLKCLDCGMMYCKACNDGRCGRCGSMRGASAGKVYIK